MKDAVTGCLGVSLIIKSFVWIDPLVEKDFIDMHKNTDNITVAEFKRIRFLLSCATAMLSLRVLNL